MTFDGSIFFSLGCAAVCVCVPFCSARVVGVRAKEGMVSVAGGVRVCRLLALEEGHAPFEFDPD